MVCMSFKIVVDSCCDLPPALLHSPHFYKVPLTIQVGDSVFVDDDSFDQSSLLWHMKESEEAPKTSCPSPAAYLDAFDCGAEDIYVVTLSALLSGSHNSAAQARLLFLEDHPGTRVHIFNSCSASSGEVLVALKILELAQSGMTSTSWSSRPLISSRRWRLSLFWRIWTISARTAVSPGFRISSPVH